MTIVTQLINRRAKGKSNKYARKSENGTQEMKAKRRQQNELIDASGAPAMQRLLKWAKGGPKVCGVAANCEQTLELMLFSLHIC